MIMRICLICRPYTKEMSDTVRFRLVGVVFMMKLILTLKCSKHKKFNQAASQISSSAHLQPVDSRLQLLLKVVKPKILSVWAASYRRWNWIRILWSKARILILLSRRGAVSWTKRENLWVSIPLDNLQKYVLKKRCRLPIFTIRNKVKVKHLYPNRWEQVLAKAFQKLRLKMLLWLQL